MNNEKILIETYHGHEIHYDVDEAKFVSSMEIADNVKTTKRQSLSDVRHEIDLFIKANVNFKPFKFITISGYGSVKTDFAVNTAEALRTDGKIKCCVGSWGSSLYGLKTLSEAKAYDQDFIDKAETLQRALSNANSIFKQGMIEIISELKPLDISEYLPILNPED